MYLFPKQCPTTVLSINYSVSCGITELSNIWVIWTPQQLIEATKIHYHVKL